MASKKQPPTRYPEHVKLGLIHEKSQACYDFLQFLSTKGILLGRYDNMSGRLVTTAPPVMELLAEFFEIDMNKIEAEKRAMVEECVKLNKRSHQ
jgi:hypothetical protein